MFHVIARTCLVLCLGLMLHAGSAHAAPPAASLDGRYEGSEGWLTVQTLAPDKIKFELMVIGPPPASNSGEAAGEAVLKGNVATYSTNDNGPCTITMTFKPNGSVQLTQAGADYECGFGHNAVAEGVWKKQKPKPPAPPPAFPGLYVNRFSLVYVQVVDPTKLKISLELTGPNDHQGFKDGEALITGSSAVLTDNADGPCTLRFDFSAKNSVRVAQQGDAADCGFGQGVMADGTYKRSKRKYTPMPH